MQCPRCHQETDARNQFCPVCGWQLIQTKRGFTPPAATTPTDDMTGVGWQPSTYTSAQQPPTGASKRWNASSSSSASQMTSGNNSSIRGTLQGVVRNFQQRTETANKLQISVWTFRLERYDERGNPLPPIPVQMRARRFEGSVNDGDTVSLHGSWQAGRIIETKKVYNVTTASTVTAHMTMKMHPVALGCLIAFMAVFIVVFIGTTFLSGSSNGGILVSPPPGQTLTDSGSSSSSPDQTLTDFCNNLKDDSYTQAYADYSSNLQKSVSYAQFTQNWTGNGSQYYHLDDCAASDVTTNGNNATTTLNTHEFYSGKTQSYAVTLIEEGNDWKIDTIQTE